MNRDESATAPDAQDTPNGIQWQNVGPPLGVFVFSALLAYVAGEGAGWRRVNGALKTAGLLMFITIAIARCVVRMLPGGHAMVAWIKVFVGVWLLVVAVWALAFAR